jgi:addiction module toxin, RelE/StbE family
MKVVITRAAERDLAEIQAYIAQDNVRAADRFIQRLLTACEALSTQSRRYPATVQDMRKRPLGDYLIFYRLTTHVDVVRILHAARDWTRLLDGD